MSKDKISGMTGMLKSNLLDFNLNTFTPQLVGSESSDSYDPAYNGVAYGRYQFTVETMQRMAKELNISMPTISQFIDNHELQDKFYKQYVNDILFFISKNNLNDFIGQYITGKSNKITTKINVYGLVAGAWLGGEGGLQKYLINGYDAKDKFGTYISDYISKFSLFNNYSV